MTMIDDRGLAERILDEKVDRGEMQRSRNPEHDKLLAVKDLSQAIGEFIDYSPYTLCEQIQYDGFNGPEFIPHRKSIQSILADWFGVDQDKLEEEKRRMLNELREANER